METLWQDVRYSWRVLKRARGFTTAAIVALAACFIPARRATRVDPLIALRAE